MTFDSETEALEHARSWDGGVPDGLSAREVEADDGNGTYSSMEACAAAGLGGWAIS